MLIQLLLYQILLHASLPDSVLVLQQDDSRIGLGRAAQILLEATDVCPGFCTTSTLRDGLAHRIFLEEGRIVLLSTSSAISTLIHDVRGVPLVEP